MEITKKKKKHYQMFLNIKNQHNVNKSLLLVLFSENFYEE